MQTYMHSHLSVVVILLAFSLSINETFQLERERTSTENKELTFLSVYISLKPCVVVVVAA